VKITEDALPKLIRSLRNRFEDGTVGGASAHGYFSPKGSRISGKLHDKIALRRLHFFNDPSVDPRLDAPYDNVPGFQSAELGIKHRDLKARVIQNRMKVRAEADGTTVIKREAAQAVESYLLNGFQEIEKRLGYRIQGAMADCQIIDGPGMIHWRTAHQKMPEYPDYEYRDDLRDTDDDEKKRFRKHREYTEGASDNRKYKLRETDDSLHERRRKQLAEAPFPYEIEVLSARNCYWVPDRSCLNGFGMVMTIQTVGWLDYENDVNGRALSDADGQTLKARLQDAETGRSIKLYTEVDAPFADGPSIDGWDETISIVTIWTRDEWYELASCGIGGATSGDSWTYITGGTHEWEMPPFALVAGLTVMDPDPALAYPPALDAMYKLKPFVDEMMTFMHVTSRNIAMPWFFLQRRDDGASLLTEDGKLKTFTWDAASGMTIPDGYELKWVDINLNGAYPQSLALILEQYKDSFPSTGTTDTTGSSQPWTVRLKQQEANVTPGEMVTAQVDALDICATSIARDSSKRALDEPDNSLWGYVEDEDGKKSLAAIPASHLKGFTIHVDIDPTGAAERTTQAQLGMQLMETGKITDYQFWDEFRGDPDPQKRLDEVTAEQTFKTYWLPGVIRQEVARIQGSNTIKNVSVGVGGELLGPNGQGMQPDEVLAMNGVVPQQAAPAINGQGPSMPGAGTLAPQGAVPIEMGVGG